MSSLTVPKRGSAAQALAALNAEDAPSNSNGQPSVHTDIRTEGYTEQKTNGSTDSRTAVPTEVNTDIHPPVKEAARTDTHPSTRKPARAATRPAANADGGDTFVDKAKARMTSREPLEGGAKTTLEYSPELSRRVKQYCLDKGKDMNGRVILTALLTTFLEEEGY